MGAAEYIGQCCRLSPSAWDVLTLVRCQSLISPLPTPSEAIQEALLKSQHRQQGGPVPAVFGVALCASMIFLRIFFY